MSGFFGLLIRLFLIRYELLVTSYKLDVARTRNP